MATLTKNRSSGQTIIARGTAEEVETFVYQARNSAGEIVQGNAKALTRADVVNALLDRGLVPLDVKGGATGALFAEGTGFRKAAKKRDLVIATRMLAAMMDSGLSYIEAIDIVRKDTEDPLLANAFNEVRIAITNGSSFSAALEAQGDVFPPIMINLITSGEAGGRVKDAMNRVADQLDKDDRLRAKVKKAMMYPMMISVVGGIVFAFMMLYLVPMFADTFLEIGGEGAKLPALTQAVVTASDIAKVVIPILLVFLVPALIWYSRSKNKDGVREIVDPLKLKIPVFGNLFHKIALARFSQNLSGLLDAGVERLQALEITARTVGNIAMERAVLKARDSQRNGLPLVEPLKDEPLFPNMVIQLVEAGERSGRTGFMLGKAGDIYDRDVDTLTDNMAELIQPLFMACLGVMIGVVVIAVYLPYMSMGDIIDQGS